QQHPHLLARDGQTPSTPNASLVASNNGSHDFNNSTAINTHNGMAPFGRRTRDVAPDPAARPSTFNSTAGYDAPVGQGASSGQATNPGQRSAIATRSQPPQPITATNSGGGWYARQRDSTQHGVASNSNSNQPPLTLAPRQVDPPRQFNHTNTAINQAQPLSQFQRAQQRLHEAMPKQQYAPQLQHLNGAIVAQPKRTQDATIVDALQWQRSPNAASTHTAVRPMAPQRPQQMIVEPQRGGSVYSSRGYDDMPIRR
ncbi:MAG: hypothetical protein ACI9G1_005100, partial [Pirellulaceae bacterium]